MWLLSLPNKHVSINECIRCSTTVSFFSFDGQQVFGAKLTLCLDVRFDHHLAGAEKLSFKDRIKIINIAFQPTRDEVSADRFYGDIGRLSKDFLGGQEKKLQHPELSCQLFPFQSRAVAWMLNRENRDYLEMLDIRSADVQSNDTHLPPLWDIADDLNNRTIYLNCHQGYISTDANWVRTVFSQPTIRGGILAEVSRIQVARD